MSQCYNCNCLLETDDMEGSGRTTDELTGICADCRCGIWGTCLFCSNYTLPPSGGDCVWCVHNGYGFIVKKYNAECPCGIHPTQCEYHK